MTTTPPWIPLSLRVQGTVGFYPEKSLGIGCGYGCVAERLAEGARHEAQLRAYWLAGEDAFLLEQPQRHPIAFTQRVSLLVKPHV